MADWAQEFRIHLEDSLAGLDKEGVLARYAWVEDLSRQAQECLAPENLANAKPEDIYKRLDGLRVPGCQVRMTNLGRMNQAEEVLQAVTRLLATPGDFTAKYRAGKIPQAGVVTLTEILSLARPHRFIIRNQLFTRALARMVPLYSVRSLGEMGYEEFLDLCRELARILIERLKPLDLAAWAEERRFLLLYAVCLGEKAEKT